MHVVGNTSVPCIGHDVCGSLSAALFQKAFLEERQVPFFLL